MNQKVTLLNTDAGSELGGQMTRVVLVRIVIVLANTKHDASPACLVSNGWIEQKKKKTCAFVCARTQPSTAIIFHVATNLLESIIYRDFFYRSARYIFLALCARPRVYVFLIYCS